MGEGVRLIKKGGFFKEGGINKKLIDKMVQPFW